MSEEIIQPCCQPWAKANQMGTDNEGYGSLVKDWGYIDSIESVPMLRIGSGLPEIRFCPWCAHAKVSMIPKEVIALAKPKTRKPKGKPKC